MHEFALAEAVVAAALHEADTERLSEIRRIRVRIGELQRIRPEVFEFAMRRVLPENEPRLRSTEIHLETEPASFRCRACERQFGLDEAGGPLAGDPGEAVHFVPELAHCFLDCPACKSPDFELLGGRGVSIESLEGA